MTRLDTILLNTKALNQTEILVKVLNRDDVKAFVINLNTEKQLRFGLDSVEGIVGLYKSFTYASEKKATGGKAPFGVMDFHVEGDYFKTFVMEVLSNGDFIIDSNTLKGDRDLRDIQGVTENIEGLIEKNFDLFINFIIPLFKNETISAIQA